MYNRGSEKSFKYQVIRLTIYLTVFAGVYFVGMRLDSEYNIISDNDQFDNTINTFSLKYNVDSLLVKAVVWRESKFRQNIRGAAGEIGLMQIMPKSATKASVVEDWEKYSKTAIKSEGNLFYPDTNIEIGTWYLSRAIGHWTEYKDKYKIGLCEYNAGKSNVNRWIKGMPKDGSIMERITFPSTHDYVKSIMVKFNYYRMEQNEEF